MVQALLVINSSMMTMPHAIQYIIYPYLLSEPQNIIKKNTSTKLTIRCLFSKECGRHTSHLYTNSGFQKSRSQEITIFTRTEKI
jgi:hypothetical protein